MKKSLIITLSAIGFIIVLMLGWAVSTYNSLVALDTEVEMAWANVESAYQRRADLIPNLVETVKAARDFEQETLTEITKLRSEAGQAKVQVESATSPEQLASAASSMDSVLSRLLVIVENYPELKSNENFLSLQDELAGTENRIKIERDRYNKAVRDYNRKVRSFPANLIASMFGFEPKKSFSATEGAEKAPGVSFE